MCPVTHICDRNSCLPKAVSGPKVKCVKCQKTSFLLCFGFERVGDGVKIALSSGCNIAVNPISMCFTCPSCDASFLTDAMNDIMESSETGTVNNLNRTSKTPASQIASNKMPTVTIKTPISSDQPPTFTQLKHDISKMSKTMISLMKAMDLQTNDLCDVKTICTETNTMVKSLNENCSKLTENAETKLIQLSNRSNLPTQLNLYSPSLPPTQPSNQTPSFSSIVKQQRRVQRNEQRDENRRPSAMKRRLVDDQKPKAVSTKPKDIPAAKMGKRTGAVGLPAAPPPEKKSIRLRGPKSSNEDKDTPIFDRSLHVSRIATSVTLNEITDYIATNSSLAPNKDFKCTLLVKKDQNIESLSFVSYKIDIVDDKCQQLTEEEFWPSGVFIRPFIPSRTLGDFIATSPGSTNAQPNKILKTTQKNENETGVNESSSSDKINTMIINEGNISGTIDLTVHLDNNMDIA